MANADRCLKDYSLAGKLSADARLALAYDAIRSAATAALRAAGYRVMRRGSEHLRTIEALEFTVDSGKKIIYELDVLRKKRNRSSYEVSGMVSDTEANHCGKLAVQLRQDVEQWIRTTYPKLL